MSVYNYKCPNCSASLLYDPNKEKLTCDYCSSEFTREEIDKYLKDNPDKIESLEGNENISASKVDDEYKIKGYTCNNCAAEVVTDETTLTTFCYYCHSPVVITDRAKGDFHPDLVIPFKYNKKSAEEKFLNWASKKRYVSKSFYSDSQLEKITGLYLPYWSVDVDLDVNIEATGYKKSVETRGDQRITKTEDYKVNKNGNIIIEYINELAYKKVDKKLLNSIEPFDLNDAKPFKIFYLNGYFSETYDIDKESISPIIENRINEYKNNLVNSMLSEFTSYNLHKKNMNEVGRKWNYALLPTWMLTYDYNGKKYIYAMNGQTGNTFGELPLDKSLIRRDATITAVIVLVLALLGGYFIW